MSLSYKHFLIPLVPEYRPEPVGIAKFGRKIIENGHVAKDFTISFAQLRSDLRTRTLKNAYTGETINIRAPSRRSEKTETLTDISQIIEAGAGHREYDVTISGDGIPANPPLIVGIVENDRWEPWANAYHHAVTCRVRSNIVRLYHLESEKDIHRPADITKYQPRFDEDCSIDEREGIFVHPELGAIRIPNAGCGMFRIEFNYGKFLFPRLRDNYINVLDDSIVAMARDVFGCDFVQACNWG
jgi:hypothetical protein